MRASVQKTAKLSWAVKVAGLYRQDFHSQPFGHQISDLNKVRAFQQTAKKYHVGAKHKATLTAVKQWLKDNKPAQFYACWRSDSPWYKDDSVEIWYTTD